MDEAMARHCFSGAKVMLFLGPRLLVLRRDHTPGISWPGMLDFPGGGREGDETPEACAIRETREEVGLLLKTSDLRLAHVRIGEGDAGFYFAARLPEEAEADIVFGDEGLGWQLMAPLDFVGADDAIPPFRKILQDHLSSC